MSFNLTLDTIFKPLTYADYSAPLRDYKAAYDEVEKAYSELVGNTEPWQNLIDKESTSARTIYDNYNKELTDIVEDFSKGMTASNRAALLRMKKDYAKKIQPIAQAVTRRRELADEQRKLRGTDNSIMFEREAGDIRVDDLLNNPELTYGRTFSGNQLTKMVAEQAEVFSKRLMNDDTYAKSLLGGDYYQVISNRGFKPEDVIAAINDEAGKGNPTAVAALQTIRDNAIEASGITGWNGMSIKDENGDIIPNVNNPIYKQAMNYANLGLRQAIGQSDSQIVASKDKDKGFMQVNGDLWYDPNKGIAYKPNTGEIWKPGTNSKISVSSSGGSGGGSNNKTLKESEGYTSFGVKKNTNGGTEDTEGRSLLSSGYTNIVGIFENDDNNNLNFSMNGEEVGKRKITISNADTNIKGDFIRAVEFNDEDMTRDATIPDEVYDKIESLINDDKIKESDNIVIVEKDNSSSGGWFSNAKSDKKYIIVTGESDLAVTKKK